MRFRAKTQEFILGMRTILFFFSYNKQRIRVPDSCTFVDKFVGEKMRQLSSDYIYLLRKIYQLSVGEAITGLNRGKV